MRRGASADEIRLVRTAAACNEKATLTLCRRFAAAIRHAVARFTSNAEERDDLHSEVVVKLLADEKRALHRWQPRSPFAAYVSSIAANHCIDWMRTNNSLPPSQLDPAALGHGSMTELLQETLLAPAHETPEAQVLENVAGETVANALEQMTADDRLILLLRYEQDLSGVEIASALGISASAARQRIFRALRRLARLMDDSEACDGDDSADQ